jgi:hypothetical protein
MLIALAAPVLWVAERVRPSVISVPWSDLGGLYLVLLLVIFGDTCGLPFLPAATPRSEVTLAV